MPLIKLGKRSGRYELSQDLYVISVRLIVEGNAIQCTLQTDSTGQDCLDYVCQRLELNQPSYFGLRFRCAAGGPANNASSVVTRRGRAVSSSSYAGAPTTSEAASGGFRWVELAKPLRKQLERHASCCQQQSRTTGAASTAMVSAVALYFSVMFHTPNVVTLSDETSRYYYFMQMRWDIIQGRLLVCPEKAILLASYGLQVEFGDHDETMHTVDSLKAHGDPLLPTYFTQHDQLLDDLLRQVIFGHRSLKGMPRGRAEALYIAEASRCDGYGEEYFQAKGEGSVMVFVGYSVNGIVVKRLNEAPFVHKWNTVHCIIAKGRHLIVRNDIQNENFIMPTADDAKYTAMVLRLQMEFYQIISSEAKSLARLAASVNEMRWKTSQQQLAATANFLEMQLRSPSSQFGVDGSPLTDNGEYMFPYSNPTLNTVIPDEVGSAASGGSLSSVAPPDPRQNPLSMPAANGHFDGAHRSHYASGSVEVQGPFHSGSFTVMDEPRSSMGDILPAYRHVPDYRSALEAPTVDQYRSWLELEDKNLRNSISQLVVNGDVSNNNTMQRMTLQQNNHQVSTNGQYENQQEFQLLNRLNRQSGLWNGATNQAVSNFSHSTPNLNQIRLPNAEEYAEMNDTVEPLNVNPSDYYDKNGNMQDPDYPRTTGSPRVRARSLSTTAVNQLRLYTDTGQPLAPSNDYSHWVRPSPPINRNAAMNGVVGAFVPPPTPVDEPRALMQQRQQMKTVGVSNDERLSQMERRLHDDDDDQGTCSLSTEFTAIPRKRVSAGVSTSQKPENVKRNRYRNIQPYEDTRVMLRPHKNNPCGYINASNIQMPLDRRTVLNYVGTQGPMKDTCGDFWQMVWETGAEVIVALTATQEENRDQCHQYWPTKRGRSGRLRFGDYQLTLQTSNCNVDRSCVTSELCLKQTTSGVRRQLYHLQYVHFASGRVPSSTASFLAFLDEVRSVKRHMHNERQRLGDSDTNRQPRPPTVVDPYHHQRSRSASMDGGSWRQRLANSHQQRQSNSSAASSSSHPQPHATTGDDGNGNMEVTAPTVVHCCSGVGRTGVYILVEVMLYALEHNYDLVIPKALSMLRQQRMLLVQTPQQYRFVYDCLVDYLSNSRLI